MRFDIKCGLKKGNAQERLSNSRQEKMIDLPSAKQSSGSLLRGLSNYRGTVNGGSTSIYS